MRCLIHKWGAWEAPREVRVRYVYLGKLLDTGISQYQRKICERCGKVKEREVTA